MSHNHITQIACTQSVIDKFKMQGHQKENTDKYIKFRYLVQPYSLATVATEAIALIHRIYINQ